MENGETYDPDLDLEAEIEAFLDEDITEITEPLWKAELTDALHDQVHDVDILKVSVSIAPFCGFVIEYISLTPT